MKAFSVVGPTMWNELLTNELRECTSVDVFKRETENSSFPSSLLTVIPIFFSFFFLSHNFQNSYFVIVDMYIFIVIVFCEHP